MKTTGGYWHLKVEVPDAIRKWHMCNIRVRKNLQSAGGTFLYIVSLQLCTFSRHYRRALRGEIDFH